jgi:hypothetical protein
MKLSSDEEQSLDSVVDSLANRWLDDAQKEKEKKETIDAWNIHEPIFVNDFRNLIKSDDKNAKFRRNFNLKEYSVKIYYDSTTKYFTLKIDDKVNNIQSEFQVIDLSQMDRTDLIFFILNALSENDPNELYKLYKDVTGQHLDDYFKSEGLKPGNKFEIYARFILKIGNWSTDNLTKGYKWVKAHHFSYGKKKHLSLEELDFILSMILTNRKSLDTLKFVLEEKLLLTI